MHSLREIAALAGVMCGALAGCAATVSHVPPESLDDTGWTLSVLHGKPVPSTPRITMSFKGGRMHGSDGCNRYGGAYAIAGTQFKVGESMISTRMACPGPVMQQAEAFLAALRSATTFRKDGATLTLSGAGGNVLLAFSEQSTALGGTSWRVTGYNNGRQAVVSVSAGTELTAEFSMAGRLSGSAGCNRYTAAYSVSGRSIRISQAAATRMYCPRPPGVMEQEALFLEALAESATYRMEGDRLELRTATGALSVTLALAERR